ncbi:MAG: hypothetical protein K6B67_04665 [Lachnospiraceae bacterium]|nr:hypothetical protein [Lachnospiraceae bacterium]
MIIQKILFPKEECCSENLMYFRDTENIDGEKNQVVINKGESLSLETYFNAFSVGKWKKYTKISNLEIRMEIKGEVEIKVEHAIGKKNDDKMYVARTPKEKEKAMSVTWEDAGFKMERSGDEYILTVDTLYDEGIVYPVITAVSDDVVFLGGSYETIIDESKLNSIDIAYCICTFKREKELTRNVNKILDSIINNPENPLYDHAEVYISDNGHTLTNDMFSSDKIHLFENKNYGGAGGFTRTMIESVFYRTGKKFTHVILMDDDIDFDEEVLVRTYKLLQLVKDEYKEAYVGGAMMELEERYMQFEYGAKWKGLHLNSFNHEWDVRLRKSVATNDEFNPVNYTGWWYCCIPTSTITENNLPVPMFIHYDDIEYGQRNSSPDVILLNGICVWHPYGENKQPISMNYYDERNIMIAMSGSGFREDTAHIIDHLSRIVTRDVMRYKYEAAQNCFKGFEDFYKGPEYFMNLNPEDNHKELCSNNYKFEDPDGIDLSKMRSKRYEEYPKFIPQLELLCHLLPSFKKLQVVSEIDIGYGFFAKNIYFYDRGKQKGYMLTRDIKKTIACLKEYRRLVKMIREDDGKIMDRWEEAKKEYTSLQFWEKYLGLK